MLKALEISTLTNPEKKIDIFLGLTTYGALNGKNCYYIVSTSRPVKFCPRSCSEISYVIVFMLIFRTVD